MNHLAGEKSPYLLQHKENPVHWYPWGEDAFEKAKSRHCPIFLSIGYSTCHWCHVMEKESFEKEDVAQALNDYFVAIKVDREERPDVDEIYMTAVQAMTGHGGWPLSVWLTPDGKPFFGGPYFPKEQFVAILKRINEIWQSEPERVQEDGEKLYSALKAHAESVEEGVDPATWTQVFSRFIDVHRTTFDEAWGGFGPAPKFPQTMNLRVLMRSYLEDPREALEGMIRLTLKGMSHGGMYDHLVGGFHRYSTDQQWLVPHFEKMLYDQALLARTYLEAWQLFKDWDYKTITAETLDFVLNEMKDSSGAFWAADDADSKNPDTGDLEEGFFATFSYEELKQNLSPLEQKALESVFNIHKDGHFEGRNILHLQWDTALNAKYEDKNLISALKILKDLRNERPQPHCDDKIIAAWNGWMIATLAKAGWVLQEENYLNAARTALHFIKTNLWDSYEEKLHRYWREGEAKQPAVSDDYVALIAACIEVVLATGDQAAWGWAQDLQRALDETFWDEKNGGYFRSQKGDRLLLTRMKEEFDGVRPNASSLGLNNLMDLYHLTGESTYKEKAEQLFHGFSKKVSEAPSALPQMLIGLEKLLSAQKELVVIAPDRESLMDSSLKEFRQNFFPQTLLLFASESENAQIPLLQNKKTMNQQITFYPCEKGKCEEPTTDVDSVKKWLKS